MLTFEKWLEEKGLTLHPWQKQASDAFFRVLYAQRGKAVGKTLLADLMLEFVNRHGNEFEVEDSPLTYHVEGDRIAVYIGFDELAFAAANHPNFWDGESGDDVPNIKITDPAAFAREVVRQLNREEEDGSTLVTKLLDRAIEDAVGDGCDGVDHD